MTFREAQEEGELALVLANRSFVYSLLARAFAEEPDEQFLELYRSEHTALELGLFEDEQARSIMRAYESSLAALDRLRSSVQYDAATEGLIDDLSKEYVRIFIGPETLLASPWESMHVTGKRVLFQPEVLAVRESYRKAGYLPASYPHVSDDALGLEVDFMSKLALDAFRCFHEEDQASALTHLENSLSFLEQHLGRWIASFADEMTDQYGDRFYVHLARILESYVMRDRDILLDVLEFQHI